MTTEMLDAHKPEDIRRAGELIKKGGLVVIPTETVYGLAANALDEDAVRSIYKAKGRPSDNPLIVHISRLSQLGALVREIPESAVRLAEHFWPGPLTIILPKSALISSVVSGGLDTVAVRLPASETARAIIDAAGCPLAAPSANTSGKPSPSRFSHVWEDLTGRVEAMVDGGHCAVGVESTVVSLTGKVPKLLRPGGVTARQLEEVLGHVELDEAVLQGLSQDVQVASPGMKYKHYSPKANVVIVDASPREYIKYVNAQVDVHALCFEEDVQYLRGPCVTYGSRYDGAAQARQLFDALHALDKCNAKTVYARIPSKNGIGLAVYNRLVRAAGFEIVNPYQHYIIGLTGGSGSGKTTVAKAMEELGCAAIDCDKISRSPNVYDEDCLRELSEYFGSDVVEDGVLNRRLLAQRAFQTTAGKEALNAITHPRILKHVQLAIEKALKSGKRLVVIDAPTLFESGFDAACARIIAVTAPREMRLARIARRDSLTPEQAEKRLGAQQEDSFYTGRADHIVSGEGDYDLEKRLLPIITGLSEKAR